MMRVRSEDGIVLVIAMMALLLMSALGLAVVLTTSTETLVASNYRSGAEGLYAADAALERAIQEVATVPDWNTLLDGSTTTALVDGLPVSAVRTLQDGSTFRVDEIVTANPGWLPYGYGNLRELVASAEGIDCPFYVLLMVARDPSGNDGVIVLRAEAVGPHGAHKAVEATLDRFDATAHDGGQGEDHPSAGIIRMLSWREVR